jgi:hypothetical protein
MGLDKIQGKREGSIQEKMSKKKLFGKNLEELTKVEISADRSEDEGSVRIDPHGPDGWKLEVELSARNLRDIDTLDYEDICDSYIKKQPGYSTTNDDDFKRNFLKDIKWYIERNAGSLGLQVTSTGKFYRRDLIQEVKNAGEDLLQNQGSITTYDIAMKLGLRGDKKTIARISYVSRIYHENWGWEEGAKKRGRITYKRK